VVVRLRIKEEGEELDRRIDLVNVVFGAALGGYIGVVMTRKTLTMTHEVVLALSLIIVVCLLVAIRNLLHVLRGTRSGTWKVPAIVLVMGVFFFIYVRGDTYLDLGVLIPIFIGWVTAFAVVVSAHVIVCRDFHL
jgi:hypothetical protein